MASTLSKVRNAVRYRIRDLAAGNRAISTPELNEIIQSNTRFIGGQIPLGEAWVTTSGTGAVVVTAGSDYGTITSTVDHMDILEVRRNADGQVLTKRTAEELDKMYWQSGTTSTRGTEEPTDYAILESAAQAVTLRFQNYAKTSTTLDVFRCVMPSDLASDASAIPFAVLAVEAIIDLSSVEAIAKLTDKVLSERNLNPKVAGLWADRAGKNLRAETERMHRQRGVGRPLRFVP
jgi:hypothetical protein